MGKSGVAEIAQDYFDYMAKSYPVMCLSDEFYFFPRAKKAIEYLDILDGFDEDKIKHDVSRVKSLRSALEKINLPDLDIEAQIDFTLLRQSLSTFLREFDQVKIWQIDPGIYLKASLLGSCRPGNVFHEKISQIPRLLEEGRRNLKNVPSAYLEVAREMADASIVYLASASFPSAETRSIKKAIDALEEFRRFLIKMPSKEVIIKDRVLIEDILRDSFSCDKSLKEIFEIAYEEYRKTLEELKDVASGVRTGAGWKAVLSKYSITAKTPEALLAVYTDEIKKLKEFIKEKDVITIPGTQEIAVKFTPQFLRPIRASASYSSPATEDRREPAYFYITADFSNVHNEYLFVSAHETYPGHHLLDSIRRSMKNPIRQQIESPLFYEGWASYSERLIDRLGYVKDPVHKLLGLKRQAWRAVRAMLDVGIRINRLKFKEAEGLLMDLGYEPKIAKFMFRHYALSPGYQLCYTIGKFEIDRLRQKFSSKLGLKRFHDLLLQGGEAPFGLIKKRLENQD